MTGQNSADIYRINSRIPWRTTYQQLAKTFDKWGVMSWNIIEPNIKAGDRKVIVRYEKDGKTIVLPMDTQGTAKDNLRVLYLAIEAMRMNEKRGIAEVIASASLQLAAPAGQKDPWEVLGLQPGEAIEVVEAVYRAKMKKAHPDMGGSLEAVQELTDALERIKNGL